MNYCSEYGPGLEYFKAVRNPGLKEGMLVNSTDE
jgi:hypothetical protein